MRPQRQNFVEKSSAQKALEERVKDSKREGWNWEGHLQKEEHRLEGISLAEAWKKAYRNAPPFHPRPVPISRYTPETDKFFEDLMKIGKEEHPTVTKAPTLDGAIAAIRGLSEQAVSVVRQYVKGWVFSLSERI